MSQCSPINGQYDEAGVWHSNKKCFVYCGPERCDCGPPLGYRRPPMGGQRRLPFPATPITQTEPSAVEQSAAELEYVSWF